MATFSLVRHGLTSFYKGVFLTTITWDTNILSADTLVSDSAATYLTGLVTHRNWALQSKLFAPTEPLTFECSTIIAVGAAGNVRAGNVLVDFLLNRAPQKAASRPSTPMREHLRILAADAQLKHQLDASLLILTEHKCWCVEAKLGTPVEITDVTKIPSAIGAGAPHARPCLESGQDGVASILEAARHEDSETNFRIEYVARKPKSRIRRAWRSFTTLKDPVRNNSLVTRSLAVIGALLTASGGVALLAGGYTGVGRLLWVFACMAGMVGAGWSLLTSLRKDRNAFYHLAFILVLASLFAWKSSEAFIVAHNLEPLFVVYGTTFIGLVALRLQCVSATYPYYALHTVAGLAVAGLLCAITVFGDPPYDWTSFIAGIAGVGAGYGGAWLAVRYMIANLNNFRGLFIR